MKRSVSLLISVVALAAGAVLLPVSHSRAQMRQTQMRQQCKPFHAIVQGMLPTPNQFEDTDAWGGTVFGTLDGEFLQGGLSGNDGTAYGDDKVSIFKGGRYKVCFAGGSAWGGPSDCANSFTYEAQAVVIWPTANSLGSYKAHAKIVKGTGRFASASGYLNIGDPFILWPDVNSPFGVYGRWNAEITGNVCDVQ
jgi:hypothetical protein